MVVAQARTPFGEPIRKPPTQTPQRQQQSQPSTNTFAANKNINNNAGAGAGGIRNVGNAGIGPPKPGVGPGAITRRPLAQQRSQLSGNASTTTGKKKKCFGGGCCKAKKKQGVQKAAPPKEKRGRFSSLFSSKKKATDGSSLKSSKPTTTSKGLTPGFPKPGIRSIGQQPPTAAPAAAKKQPQQLTTSRSSTTTAPVQSKQQQPQKQQQVPLGAPAKSSSKDVKSDNKKKDEKKVLSKIDAKKSHQKSLTESPKNSEKELKTGIEDSEKEEIKKPVTKSSSKSGGKDLANKSCRSFQEVKVSVSNFDNGMTERKVVMTSIYPSNESPPNPFMACAAPATAACPRTGKNSYTSLKHANSVERVPPQILKGPTHARKEVKNLLLKTIDEAADDIKQLPRVSSNPPPASVAAGTLQQPLAKNRQNAKNEPLKLAKSSSNDFSSISTSLVSATLSTISSTKQSTAAPSPKTTAVATGGKAACALLCPFNPAAQKAIPKPRYSRDIFSSHSRRHTVTREYRNAAGAPILSSTTNSLVEQLNKVVLQKCGKEDVSKMDLDFKLTKLDGTMKNVKVGIELPKKSD